VEYKNSGALAKAANAEGSANIEKAVTFLRKNKGISFDQALKEVMQLGNSPEGIAYDKTLKEIGEKIAQIKPASSEECAALIKLQREYEAVGKAKVDSIVLKVVGQQSTYTTGPLDERIVGKWEGMRGKSTQCQLLSWNSNFTPSGMFEITFFSDKEKTKIINTEKGSWKASNGKNELKTDGVPTPEVYLYTVIDNDTIKYVNTVRDPSADCQADYEFTERRVKK